MSRPSGAQTPFKCALKTPVPASGVPGDTVGAGRGRRAALAGSPAGVRMQGNFRTMPEAVRYFAEKANVPTRTWRDLWQGQHARAFTVAGAMKADLLADLRRAVDGAIRDGESLGAFRKRFDQIVATHGWAYNGGRNWRTRVIYDTNVRTAHMAGKYAQLTDPDTLARHPYWEYRHTTLDNPRLQHKSWSGLILRHDDPWWRTHYPPNGWGCHCDVLPVSRRRLQQLGKTEPDTAPEDADGDVPPEWQYNVGKAAWGRAIAGDTLRDASAWNPIRAVDAPVAPITFPADPVPRPLLPATTDAAAVRRAWSEHVGPQAVVVEPTAGRVILTDQIPERWIADGLLDGREQFVPMLAHIVGEPAEIWINWVVGPDGRYDIRRHLLAAFRTEAGVSPVAVVATAGGIGLDLVVGDAVAALRQGHRVWSRPE